MQTHAGRITALACDSETLPIGCGHVCEAAAWPPVFSVAVAQHVSLPIQFRASYAPVEPSTSCNIYILASLNRNWRTKLPKYIESSGDPVAARAHQLPGLPVNDCSLDQP